MSVTCHSLATNPKTGESWKFKTTGGGFRWLVRRGLFTPCGVILLDADTEWTPEGWPKTYEDHMRIGPEDVRAMLKVAQSWREALTYGLANRRPWVTEADRNQECRLDEWIHFLTVCEGFTTT